MQIRWRLRAACFVACAALAAAGCGSDGADDSGGEDPPGSQATGDAGGNGNPQSTPTGLGPPPAFGASPVSVPPGVPAARVRPVVVIQTSQGSFTVELDKERAPTTVDNFLTYVNEGFYDGTVFHQVYRGAVILGGAYTPEFVEKPTRPGIPNEAHNGLKNMRGTIAMARVYNEVNSATCQFFINVQDNPNYDHKPGSSIDGNLEDYGYCVFGTVAEESMAVVSRIANVEVQDTDQFERRPAQTVMIESVRQIR
ncbi:MAG: peptidylprolyl isomerase [Planctomycetota bacterium]|jgi:cyclophilin family peptidyl-prolyl cis-trans isomerase